MLAVEVEGLVKVYPGGKPALAGPWSPASSSPFRFLLAPAFPPGPWLPGWLQAVCNGNSVAYGIETDSGCWSSATTAATSRTAHGRGRSCLVITPAATAAFWATLGGGGCGMGACPLL
jgi:hypothetical protein